jgi:hypothetical protein
MKRVENHMINLKIMQKGNFSSKLYCIAFLASASRDERESHCKMTKKQRRLLICYILIIKTDHLGVNNLYLFFFFCFYHIKNP